MVAAMDYIQKEVLNKGDVRISTSSEAVHIYSITEDSPIIKSSLPTEEYIGYNQDLSRAYPPFKAPCAFTYLWTNWFLPRAPQECRPST